MSRIQKKAKKGKKYLRTNSSKYRKNEEKKKIANKNDMINAKKMKKKAHLATITRNENNKISKYYLHSENDNLSLKGISIG